MAGFSRGFRRFWPLLEGFFMDFLQLLDRLRLDCCSPLLRELDAGKGFGVWHLRSRPGAIICDAITMALVLEPEMVLRSSLVHVAVELSGHLTRGQTVVDHRNSSIDTVFCHRKALERP